MVTHLSTSVLSQQAVPLAIVERNLSSFNEKTTMEGQRELFNLNITSLDVGRKDTGSRSNQRWINTRTIKMQCLAVRTCR